MDPVLEKRRFFLYPLLERGACAAPVHSFPDSVKLQSDYEPTTNVFLDQRLEATYDA